MNISGNVRFQSTREVIEKTVISLLKRRGYDGFTIKEVCKEAGINRSTFYAHFTDVNDLMIKVESKLYQKLQDIWKPAQTYNQDTFIEFFTFIKEHRVFYKAFLKSHNPSFAAPDMLKKQKDLFKKFLFKEGVQYSDAEIEYHLYYFGGGLKAVCGLWLQRDCSESPEEMAKVIYNEYANNAKHFK